MQNQLVIGGFESEDSVRVHEDAFSCLRLRIELDKCWIGVSSGVKNDNRYENERLAACHAASAASTLTAKSDEKDDRDPSASEKNQNAPKDDDPFHGQYTYIAFWFEEASFTVMSGSDRDPRSRTAVTRWKHHISLAYLPYMTAAQRINLEEKMNKLFDEWKEIEPGHGPLELLTSRGFLIGQLLHNTVDIGAVKTFDQRWPGTDIYTRYTSDFRFKNLKDICGLVDEGLLSFITEPKMITRKKNGWY